MNKLSLVEKMISCYQRGETMPIKGHAKIVLADPITGKPKEIIESDNIVTNAVASILANNYEGTSDFQNAKLSPLRNLFGGVLLFQNPLTENADNYNVPSELVSPLIAHAGDVPNNTESLLRSQTHQSNKFGFGRQHTEMEISTVSAFARIHSATWAQSLLMQNFLPFLDLASQRVSRIQAQFQKKLSTNTQSPFLLMDSMDIVFGSPAQHSQSPK